MALFKAFALLFIPMKNNLCTVFLAGDVCASVGVRAVTNLLPKLIERESIDFCVINGENATGGIGLSSGDAEAILAAGADVITGGNHSFEKRDHWPVLDVNPAVLRPANFPSRGLTAEESLPGHGMGIYEKNGHTFAVFNVQGREDMTALDCPFVYIRTALETLSLKDSGAMILVDFHAESTQEKEAFALMLDGKVSVVAGTHTHVQTADERVLPGGTAYITDLGMTGPWRSVIGSAPEISIKRNITQVLYRMEAAEGAAALRGLLVYIDPETRKAISVRRVEVIEETV